MQNLQQLLERKIEENDRLMLLFSALKDGSDQLATNLLARMRMGEEIQSLIRELGPPQPSIAGYVVHERPLQALLIDTRTLLTSSREPQDVSDSQDSKSMQSWPPSPLDQGGWSTWNVRSPPGRTMSLSSEPHLSLPRASSSYYSYPVPNRAPQVDGESSGHEYSPYFQGEYQLDGEMEFTEEADPAPDLSHTFAVPRRPSRGRGR